MNEIPDILLVLLGFLVGGFGTLIGAGGGFILVPVLLILYPNAKPELVTSISLAIVFLNAASGSVAYARMKRIDYKSALLFTAATIPGAVIGAFSTSLIPRKIFDLVLGVLLCVISLYLIFRGKIDQQVGRPVKPGQTTRVITEKNGAVHRYSFNEWIGVALSFVVGFLSSMLGIGGGIIHVPALTSLLHFPVHIATATSHFILAFMALAGTIVHIIQGNFQDGVHTTIFIGIGVIAGAQIGAKLSDKLKGSLIVKALALALMVVAVRLFLA